MSLFYAGVTGVTRAALYKPLSNNDKDAVSGIVNATEAFMRKISGIFLAALLLFALLYPFLVAEDFGWWFACSLVLIIGISTFFQYFFATPYKILLAADQNNFIVTAINIATLVASTLISVVLIKCGCSIHAVKLGSAAVYILNPIAINIYAKRRYGLNKNAVPDNSALSQRWDAFAHSVANLVNTNADIVLLTVFTSVREVSVYTIYYLVINGVNKIGSALSSGIEAAFGNMLAKNDRDVLVRIMNAYETLMFFLSCVIYTCCAVMIVPFVRVYTSGVTDADYIRPLFGYLVSAAGFFATLRIPYQTLTQAAGQYKRTKRGAIFEAVIHIILSLVLVIRFGLIGVTIGTLAAMIFRTCQYAVFVYKNITGLSLTHFIKRIAASAVCISLAIFGSLAFPPDYIASYRSWVIYATVLFATSAVLSGITSFIFFSNDIRRIIEVIKNMLKKRK